MTADNYLGISIKFLKIAGIYPIETKSRTKILMLYLWRTVVNLALAVLIILNAINVVKKRSVDFIYAVESMVYIGVALVMISRKNYLIIFGADSFKIVDEMLQLFKQDVTIIGTKGKSLETHATLARNLTIFWAVSATITSQILLCSRLIFNSGEERTFPLPLWFPEEWKASPYYEFTALYQSFVFEMMAIIAVGIDSFFASTVVYTCAQFDLLGWECKCLLYRVMPAEQKKLLVKIGEDEVIPFEKVSLRQIDEILASKQVRADMLKRFNELIAFHQALLEFCDRFNEIFAPVFLSYFVILVTTLVFITYTIITTNDMTRLGAFMTYYVSSVFTLFLPCYFGNLLTTQGEKLFRDLYDSPWYVCDESFKSNFRIIYLRACKPLMLSIGKFGELSLSVFFSVMQSTLSYALVLRHLTEEE